MRFERVVPFEKVQRESKSISPSESPSAPSLAGRWQRCETIPDTSGPKVQLLHCRNYDLNSVR